MANCHYYYCYYDDELLLFECILLYCVVVGCSLCFVLRIVFDCEVMCCVALRCIMLLLYIKSTIMYVGCLLYFRLMFGKSATAAATIMTTYVEQRHYHTVVGIG